MSIQAVSWALQARVGGSTLKLVLIAVANYTDHDGRCWPSSEALALDTELSVRTIKAALGDLEKAGWLSRQERRRPDGTQASSIFTLNFDQSATSAPRKDRVQSASEQSANDGNSRVQMTVEQSAAAAPLTTFEPSIEEPSVTAQQCVRDRELSITEVEREIFPLVGMAPVAVNPDISPVMACVRNGATVEDIRNGVRWRMANGPPLRRWDGVTGPIMQAHANRTKPPPQFENNQFGARHELRPTVQDVAGSLADWTERAERGEAFDVLAIGSG